MIQHVIFWQLYYSFPLFSRWMRKRIKLEITRLKLRKRGSFSDSTWISLATRHWLEKDRIRVLLGGPIMAAVMVGGATSYTDTSNALTQWEVDQPLEGVISYELEAPENKINTDFALPVQTLYGISQNYHGGHRGLDLRAPLGSGVVAIDTGIVKLVEYGSLGYGRRVIIEHDNAVESMYAHLGRVEANTGEVVAAGDKIGEIGMTGWSTGPHLHFEISESGSNVNPLGYIKPALEAYQQALLQG